jgi:hypothetical protein
MSRKCQHLKTRKWRNESVSAAKYRRGISIEASSLKANVAK